MNAIQKDNAAEAVVNKTSAHSFLTDKGRRGGQVMGLCSGGAADAYAYYWANRLLDNHATAAAIEITFGPFSLTFKAATRIAVCGAISTIKLGNKLIPPWSSTHVAAGDTLYIAIPTSGLRQYLAIDGGFKSALFFESCESLQYDFTTRTLAVGDSLWYTPDRNHNKPNHGLNRTVSWRATPNYSKELVLRINPCYQFHQFTTHAVEQLLKSCYTVHPNSNRMGYRLAGKTIEWGHKGILSEGIAFGSVQIPPNGQPIVLLNDRQTIGGYPKVGCVHTADCYQLAQRRPGQAVRFTLEPYP
ncbi:5-oxoprolinase subunit C family protein [Teredinibacter purpureus]|uniref:5-oxoprolinase subunit C family protein n=1 Tax=Teredinibacter purpureus TaxID=2731756 RepID=UPI0005F81C3C|nr:biotin-dependent carboxyltransferase family protein [Teredinibacter purpureus]